MKISHANEREFCGVFIRCRNTFLLAVFAGKKISISRPFVCFAGNNSLCR